MCNSLSIAHQADNTVVRFVAIMEASYPLQVSFVLATHNRCAVVMKTLAQLGGCGLARADYEVIVVDNASKDGTPDAVVAQSDILLRLRRNAGSCAKSYGVQRARGRFIVFLDDDSFPRPGSVPRMIERFEADPKLGAAGFVVHLPDGRLEGGALPDVFVGCGVGFRAEALRQAGGLDPSFFMQAEEYDLTFRLVGSGWRVKMFPDLHVDHLKTVWARKTARTTYYDVRNNMRIVSRYLPSPYYEIYREDWIQRYRWLARRDGHGPSFARGARAGRWRGVLERWTYRKLRLTPDALEHFFGWDCVHRRMTGLVASGACRIVLADLGKNVFTFHRAAKLAGLVIQAIGDDRFYAAGRRYRGTPIVPLEDALNLGGDAVVVGNSSAVHGTDTYHRLLAKTSQPVHHWFDPADTLNTAGNDSVESAPQADDTRARPAGAVRD